jgi:penicillin-binding protein-related factor A (putative recombinase)
MAKRRGGAFAAVYAEKSTVDFMGIIDEGLGVCVEAKSALTPTRIPLKVRSHPVIRPHQAKCLADAHRMGALAGVVIRLGPNTDATWYALTWPGWLGAVAATAPRLSVSASLLATWGEVIDTSSRRVDWLTALVEAERKDMRMGS